MNNKVIITLPGYNSNDVSITPDKCAIHSDYAMPKIAPNIKQASIDSSLMTLVSQSEPKYNSGWLDFTWKANPAAGTHTLLTLNHGFNYVPSFTASMYEPLYDFYRLLPNMFYTVAGGNDIYIYCSADINNFYIKILVSATPGIDLIGQEMILRYFVFCENGL